MKLTKEEIAYIKNLFIAFKNQTGISLDATELIKKMDEELDVAYADYKEDNDRYVKEGYDKDYKNAIKFITENDIDPEEYMAAFDEYRNDQSKVNNKVNIQNIISSLEEKYKEKGYANANEEALDFAALVNRGLHYGNMEDFSAPYFVNNLNRTYKNAYEKYFKEVLAKAQAPQVSGKEVKYENITEEFEMMMMNLYAKVLNPRMGAFSEKNRPLMKNVAYGGHNLNTETTEHGIIEHVSYEYAYRNWLNTNRASELIAEMRNSDKNHFADYNELLSEKMNQLISYNENHENILSSVEAGKMIACEYLAMKAHYDRRGFFNKWTPTARHEKARYTEIERYMKNNYKDVNDVEKFMKNVARLIPSNKTKAVYDSFDLSIKNSKAISKDGEFVFEGNDYDAHLEDVIREQTKANDEAIKNKDIAKKAEVYANDKVLPILKEIAKNPASCEKVASHKIENREKKARKANPDYVEKTNDEKAKEAEQIKGEWIAYVDACKDAKKLEVTMNHSGVQYDTKMVNEAREKAKKEYVDNPEAYGYQEEAKKVEPVVKQVEINLDDPIYQLDSKDMPILNINKEMNQEIVKDNNVIVNEENNVIAK